MIKRVKYKGSIKAQWDALYAENKGMTPYQSRAFFDFFRKGFSFSAVRRTYRCEILQYEGKSIVILPVCVSKKQKQVCLVGDLSSVSYCDLIYPSTITNDELLTVLSELKDYFGESYTIQLSKLKESSQLRCALEEKYSAFSKQGSVSIDLPSLYESYYARLSKNTRQNIRTAQNRLARDGKKLDIVFYDGDSALGIKEKNRLITMYCRRMKTKFGYSNLKSFEQFLTQRYTNSVWKALFYSANHFHALLYIDQILAAALSGFYNEEHTVITVPKLTMNDELAFYEPGVLLINETVKYLLNSTKVRVLDLARGTEKYKFAMGGNEQNNYEYHL